MSALAVDPHVAQQGAQALTISRHFIDASFTMLVYDHLLTFGDEVERIWRPRFTGATLLFLLNRYFTPLQFIVNIASFFDAAWSRNEAACVHFVHFPGASTMCSIAIIEIILMTRTYALYGATSRLLLAFLVLLFAAQMTVMGIALSKSQMLNLPPGASGCILTGSNGFFAAFWIAPLVTDSIIFILTLWKTHEYSRRNVKTPILHILRRDGILYFSVIFAANLLNVFLYSLAEEGMKAIGASFSQLATTVMISRLQLNLRNPSARAASTAATTGGDYASSPSSSPRTPNTPQVARNHYGGGGGGLHPLALGPAKLGEVSSHFFVETLLSLGQPLDEGYASESWEVEGVDALGGKAGERAAEEGGGESRGAGGNGEEWQLHPLRGTMPFSARTDHDRYRLGDSDRPATGGTAGKLSTPPCRRVALFEDFAGGISISPALIDGPDGPMLHEEWKRRTVQTGTQV